MSADTTTMEDICLAQDSGSDVRFRGRLFSECSWLEEEGGVLTRQKLYTTEEGGRFCDIGRSDGKEHTRHAYRLNVQENMCVIHNGNTEMRIQFDMLMLAVRSLCGLADGATPSLEQVEEMLKAANA